MIVTSINQRISDRPGYKIINAGATEGFFLIYYAQESDETGRIALTIYYNQDGREVFVIEE